MSPNADQTSTRSALCTHQLFLWLKWGLHWFAVPAMDSRLTGSGGKVQTQPLFEAQTLCKQVIQSLPIVLWMYQFFFNRFMVKKNKKYFVSKFNSSNLFEPESPWKAPVYPLCWFHFTGPPRTSYHQGCVTQNVSYTDYWEYENYKAYKLGKKYRGASFPGVLVQLGKQTNQGGWVEYQSCFLMLKCRKRKRSSLRAASNWKGTVGFPSGPVCFPFRSSAALEDICALPCALFAFWPGSVLLIQGVSLLREDFFCFLCPVSPVNFLAVSVPGAPVVSTFRTH